MPDSLEIRVYRIWFYAGATAAVFLLSIIPLLWRSWPLSLVLLLLQLPAYMFHQVEEYHHDRFRLTLNHELAGGRDVLTPGFALLVNLGGIWLVDLITLYLAYFIRPGLALIAMYLAIVNAVVHIAVALAKRSYNPGLVTALLLLLPAGCAGWWNLHQTHQAAAPDHIVGLAVALGIHILIAIHLIRRVKLLRSSPAL